MRLSDRRFGRRLAYLSSLAHDIPNELAPILSIMVLGRWLIQRTAIPQPAWAWRLAPYGIGGVAAFWMVQRIAAF